MNTPQYRWVRSLATTADPSKVFHPSRIVRGFSDLMVEVFGEEARKEGSAVGMSSLPAGIPVETEAIFQVRK